MRHLWAAGPRAWGKPGRRQRGGHASHRLSVGFEPLEQRLLLATLHVATTGSDAAAGSAMAPFQSLQRAVNAAAAGDTILVAAGTYGYNAALGAAFQSSFDTTAVMFVFNKELTIRGGYSAADWITRDTVAAPTIIDGAGTTRGIMVCSIGAATGITLDGITVQNGFATGIPARGGDSAIFGFGGGMFVDFGNGAALKARPVVLQDVTFRTNRAVGNDTATDYGGYGAGGGIAFRHAQNVTIQNALFEGNEARGGVGPARGGDGLGGAIHADRSTITVQTTRFFNNLALGASTAGATGGEGLGGAVSNQIEGGITYQDVVAIGNVARGGNGTNQGGGAFGGAFFMELSSLSISTSDLRNNLAESGNASVGDGGAAGGGGIETKEGPVQIDRSIIVGNRVRGGSGGRYAGPPGGGGIYLTSFFEQSAVSVVNSVIADNLVEFVGAGSKDLGGGGGGIYLQGVSATIRHTTVSGNRLGADLVYGQALVLVGDFTPLGTVANLSYNIFADHTGTTHWATDTINARAGCTINLDRNLFANNTLINWFDSPGILNGAASNITAATAGFITAAAPDYDVGLAAASPAINAAVGSATSVDLYGNARSGTPDLGALEHGSLSTSLRVSSPGNSGPGSLRAALAAADARPGADAVTIALPAASIIDITSPLPFIGGTLTVDARGVTAWNGTPAITVRGTAAAGSGFVFASSAINSLVRGLAIKGFGGGFGIYTNAAGTSVTGCVLSENLVGIVLAASANAAIGGAGSDRVVMDANSFSGLLALGAVTSSNVTNATVTGTGVAAVLASATGLTITASSLAVTGGNSVVFVSGDATGSAVQKSTLSGGATGVTLVGATNFSLGGTGSGAAAKGNTIGGYSGFGLYAAGTLSGASVAGNVFQGTVAGSSGMVLADALGLAVGPAADGGNRIEGHAGGFGIFATGNLAGSSVASTVIDGGFVGVMLESARGLSVGVAGRGNDVARAAAFGMLGRGTLTGTLVMGNLLRANTQFGLVLSSATGVVIGGATAGAGNTISGNNAGVWIEGINTGSAFRGNTIENNATNGLVLSAAQGIEIGGSTAADGNVIRSHLAGVGLFATGTCTGSAVRRNTVSGNLADVGIDGATGLTYEP